MLLVAVGWCDEGADMILSLECNIMIVAVCVCAFVYPVAIRCTVFVWANLLKIDGEIV